MKVFKSSLAKIFSIFLLLVVVTGCTQTPPATELTNDQGTTLVGKSINPPDKDKSIENDKYSVRLVDFRESGDLGIAVLEVTNKTNVSDFFSSAFYVKLTSDEQKYQAFSATPFQTYSMDGSYKYADGVNFEKNIIAAGAKMTGEIPYIVNDDSSRLFLIVVNLQDSEVGRFRIR